MGGKREGDEEAAILASAMNFVIQGCDHQPIPETKPWIGRLTFADESRENPNIHQAGAGVPAKDDVNSWGHDQQPPRPQQMAQQQAGRNQQLHDFDALGEVWKQRWDGHRM